jgi:hypothetical protein
MTFSQREFRQLAGRSFPGLGHKLEKQFLKSPERHARKCVICRHPERRAIEAAFMEWRLTDEIAVQFCLTSDRPLYRHAHATGLFELRRTRLIYAAITIADRSSLDSPTGDADALLRALEVAGKSAARLARRANRKARPNRDSRPKEYSPEKRSSTNAISRHAVEIEPGIELRIATRNTPLISNRNNAVRLETIATR